MPWPSKDLDIELLRKECLDVLVRAALGQDARYFLEFAARNLAENAGCQRSELLRGRHRKARRMRIGGKNGLLRVAVSVGRPNSVYAKCGGIRVAAIGLQYLADALLNPFVARFTLARETHPPEHQKRGCALRGGSDRAQRPSLQLLPCGGPRRFRKRPFSSRGGSLAALGAVRGRVRLRTSMSSSSAVFARARLQT
jgi:hypothetical protein